MRGRCAPMRWATAGVKTVVSAPVSRRRVTAAPLANKVTIGALRRVATVVSPSGIAPQPPGPPAAYCVGAASGAGSPEESAETNVAAASAPLNHLFTGNPLIDWALNRAHRGDICDRSVQGERDEPFAEPTGHARLRGDPGGPAQFASGAHRPANGSVWLARTRSRARSPAGARRIRARRLAAGARPRRGGIGARLSRLWTMRRVRWLLWLGERRTVPRRAAPIASLSEHGRRLCPLGRQLQLGRRDGDPAACHRPLGGGRRQQCQLG